MAKDEENDGKRIYEGFKQVSIHAVRGYTRAE